MKKGRNGKKSRDKSKRNQLLMDPCCEVPATLVLVLDLTTEHATIVVNLGTWHGNVRNRGRREDETKNRVLPVEVRVSN
jgi:hypothetical protein